MRPIRRHKVVDRRKALGKVLFRNGAESASISLVNRTQLQILSEERARDAEALLDVGRWSGAYYLAGYAVECGLKACIAKLTQQHDFPDQKFVNSSFTHKIEDLIKLAGLGLQRDTDVKSKPLLGSNWLIIKDWNEVARYQCWTELHARKLVSAVTDTTNGVLPWIRIHW